MLDLNAIRQNPDEIQRRLQTRDPDIRLDEISRLDARRREIIQEGEQLKRRRNEASEEIAQLKRDGDEDAAQRRIAETKEISDRIKAIDDELGEVESDLNDRLARLPNIPYDDVPASLDEADKVVVCEHGEPPNLDVEPEHHLDLGERLGLLDFPRAARIAGSRFPMYVGWGARLEMGLIQFFWDFNFHQSGYAPIIPPFLGNSASMFTAAQLPKFRDDVYHIETDDLFLNPTSETILCNLHRDEILDAEQLPLKYAAYTTCFRREAGAAGEEERGLIRMHQFNKVELFKFTDAESSDDELASLVADAEAVLQELGLHYRVVLLPTGDMAGQSAKTYDIEVWVPSTGRYHEVSSVSNCTDYQARRGDIRYRPDPDAKPEFVHTLNGSGLATSRLMASILETKQQADGSVIVPEVLRPYVGTSTIGHQE
ncbi:MAG: serine--tRNA ligase [Candidatus Bipolaricaulia bacterium]